MSETKIVDVEPKSHSRTAVHIPQVQASHYRHVYSTKERFASFWHQIDEVMAFNPHTVLEVGIGSGFTSAGLRREEIYHIGMDIDSALNPNLLGSVLSIPLAANAVDAVLCCQVLEHLPFCEFQRAISELWRIAKSGMVISLPDRDPYLRVSVRGPKKLAIDLFTRIPRPPFMSLSKDILGSEHCWEIGCDGVRLQNVLDAISTVTKCTAKTYRVLENPYHRFFIVRKCD